MKNRKALNKSQWRKSCPNCSQREGKLIYYDYPESFGTSEKRITALEPSGAQSWCYECRIKELKNVTA
jgi:hypothetical protein